MVYVKPNEIDWAKGIVSEEVGWVHRVTLLTCTVTYYYEDREENGSTVESMNGPWDTVYVEARRFGSHRKIGFKRHVPESMRDFESLLLMLEDTYDLGKRAKAYEIRSTLYMKEGL